LIEEAKDDTPTKCKLKISKSTQIPECPIVLDNGGYIVQPVPGPLSAIPADKSNIKEGGISQNPKLLSRGKAISGAPIKIGTKKLPKPPNVIGIITKNNIKMPCIVTITL
jgi:hypothetical protein